MWKCVFAYRQTAKAQISLRAYAVWSGPSLSANRTTGYYRVYERRAKARMLLCAHAGWSEFVYFAYVRGQWFAWRGPITKSLCKMPSTDVLLKQEAHGPRFAHLSGIATADMQMLCKMFPILSLQLMEGSSFKQILLLKKNIWASQCDHFNKLSITFQL